MGQPSISLVLFSAILFVALLSQITWDWLNQIGTSVMGMCTLSVILTWASIIIKNVFSAFGYPVPFLARQFSPTGWDCINSLVKYCKFILTCLQFMWKYWHVIAVFLEVCTTCMVFWFIGICLTIEPQASLSNSFSELYEVFLSDDFEVLALWIRKCKRDPYKERLGKLNFYTFDDFLQCGSTMYCQQDPPLTSLNYQICGWNYVLLFKTWLALDKTEIDTWFGITFQKVGLLGFVVVIVAILLWFNWWSLKEYAKADEKADEKKRRKSFSKHV